jgi:hypothetical protein
VEKKLLSTLSLPLNLRDNAHPFMPSLKSIRKAAKEMATTLNVIVESGGPRKVKE